MLPHDHVVELVRLHELHEPVVGFGIVFRLDSEQDLDILFVFLFQIPHAVNISVKFPGAHPEIAVVFRARKELRTVVGKSQRLEACFDRRFNIFPVLALSVIAALGVGVKIVFHVYFLIRIIMFFCLIIVYNKITGFSITADLFL